jgi:hypothetical protein
MDHLKKVFLNNFWFNENLGEYFTIDNEPLRRNVGTVDALMKRTADVWKLVAVRDPKR